MSSRLSTVCKLLPLTAAALVAAVIHRWGKAVLGLAIVLVALAALAVACGGDDGGDSTATTAATDATAACDAFVAYSQAFDINEDLEAGIASLKDFAAAVPEDVAAAVEPLISRLEEDPEAVFASEGAVPGDTEADQYALENCGDTRVDVDAYNFAFVGMPSELEAGRVAFNMVNRTQTGEFHEALLLRQDDGVTETANDQLVEALGEPISVEGTINALEQFDFVAVGFVQPEGLDPEDVFVADLEPGRYVLACLLPEKSPELLDAYFAGEEITGKSRHSDLGMFVEFTVK